MNLPKWMSRTIKNENELIVFNAKLAKALTIAVEALEQFDCPEMTAGCPCGPVAKDALRRIKELGK